MKKASISKKYNLEEEKKEYRKLCFGKSTKYAYYLDWKKDNMEKIDDNFNPKAELINFKHYIINCKRSAEMGNETIGSILTCCFTLLLARFMPDNIEEYVNINIPNWVLQVIYIVLVVGGVCSVVVISMLLIKDRTKTEYSFYCDLLEVIDEVLSERKEQAISDKEKENG